MSGSAKLALLVDVGDGAQMTMPMPELEWQLRYGKPEGVRYVAASAIETLMHLVNSSTKAEGWRRIKLMRKAFAAAVGTLSGEE